MTEISIISDELSLNFSEAVRMAAQCGIRRMELRTLTGGRVPACSAADRIEVDDALRNEGITVTALSPGLFKHAATESDFRYELRELLPRSLELAHGWQVSKMLVFGFKKSSQQDVKEARRIAAQWLAEAAEIAETAGVTLLLEPEPICLADTGVHAAAMIQSVNSPALAMNYDPGNVAWQTGQNPSAEMEQIAPAIRHLHLKDAAAGGYPGEPRWVLPGDGIVDFETIFRALQQQNYAGEIALEPHMPGIDLATLRTFKERVVALWAHAQQAPFATSISHYDEADLPGSMCFHATPLL